MSFSPRRSGTRRTSPAFRPGLHPLEAREVPAVFTVTNTSGDPNTRLSLPWAMLQANANPGADTINFNIPGAGPQVISLTGPVYLNDTVTVDGTTQPGYNGTPLIAVRGQGAVNVLLVMNADPAHGTNGSGSTVRGLALDDFRDQAILITAQSTGDTIANNWIGFYRDANGALHTNNQTYPPSVTLAPAGITLGSSNTTIAGNTIGAVFNGINVGEDPVGRWSGVVYSGNVIRDNRIGTDPTGTSSGVFGNFADGILVGAGAKNNDFGPNNVLSGNVAAGIELLHASTTGNTIFGNRIGTDATGFNPIPNTNLGIEVANGANGNTIGGPRGGNVIAANGGGGISLGIAQLPGASGNLVQGNILGLNANQTAVVGTQGVGVVIQSGAANNVLDGNVIAGHTQPGVALSNTSGNTIRSNWIGESATGAPFPNPFGVVFQANAVNNTATGNAFGPNTYANYFVADPSATGNVIDATSPPTTPPPPPTSPPPPPASGTGSPIVGNPVVVSGSPDSKAVVYTADAAGTLRQAGSPITAFPGFAGAVRTASADVNNDGFQDVILVTGPGTPARFTVMSGKDGTTMLVGATDPFGGDFTGGAFVAAGDLNGDGRAEFVFTPDQGGGPNTVIYSLNADGSLATPKAFFALGNPTFRGGARPAMGDVNHDGVADLAIGAGFLGGPNVEIHDGKSVAAGDYNTLIGSGFFAFPGSDATTLRNGVFLAVGDVNGDGFADLIAGGGPGGGPRVLILDGKLLSAGDVNGAYSAPVANFFFGDPSSRGGVRVATTNIDGDNRADVVVGSGEGAASQARVYLGKSVTPSGEPAQFQSLDPYAAVLPGGVYVG